MQQYPCRNCTERYIGCHATCEKYIAAVKANREEKEHIRKMEMGGVEYHAFQKDNIDRERKKRGKDWMRRRIGCPGDR